MTKELGGNGKWHNFVYFYSEQSFHPAALYHPAVDLWDQPNDCVLNPLSQTCF